MAWNNSVVHSDFNFDERIWSSGALRANFIVHFDIGPLWATSPNTLNQIEIWVWVHTANIPGYCLWVDTPHAYVWATGNVHFLLGEPCFEVHFPPAKNLWNPVLANYLFCLHFWHALQYMAPLGSKWLQMAPNGSKCLQMAPNVSKWLQIALNCSKLLQIAPHGYKLLHLTLNVSKWLHASIWLQKFQLAPNVSKCL